MNYALSHPDVIVDVDSIARRFLCDHYDRTGRAPSMRVMDFLERETSFAGIDVPATVDRDELHYDLRQHHMPNHHVATLDYERVVDLLTPI